MRRTLSRCRAVARTGGLRPIAVRLHLTHIPELDHLIALEYGRVDEGTPEEAWQRVGRTMGYLYDASATAVGFKVVEASEFDVDAPDVAEIWGAPLFDAPTLGLTAASAGEIILAARTLFGERASIGHELFTRAAEAADDEQALGLWLAALEAGEAVAHWGAGMTLFRLGRFREAYQHLRYYTELAPQLTFTWFAYGQAAEALGLNGEAYSAYSRAVALEEAGGPATGAREALAELTRPRRATHRRRDRRRRRR